MAKVKLTNERIRTFFCPEGKAQVFLWDTEAPRLAVRATAGASAFIFQGSLDNRTVRITIGDVRDWKLDKAREEARRLQLLMDKGIDPREEKREQEALRAARKAEREAAKQADEARQKYTLRALCDAYADHLKGRSTKSAIDARSVFNRHIGDDLGAKPARDVRPVDLAHAIRTVHEAGKIRTAGKLRSYLHAAYEVGIKAELDSRIPALFIPFRIEQNPAHPVPAIPGNSGDRVLSVDELNAYVSRLTDSAPDAALKVALYGGGQRMQQLLRASVSDWDGENLRLFDAKGRRQKPREHLLPLAPVAAGIVGELSEAAKARQSNLLFSTFGRVALSAETISKRVREISDDMGGEPFNLLDIRRTVETMMASMKISKELRSHLLSHGLGGVQDKHYDRFDYLDDKRDALRKWERRLQEIVNGKKPGKVVALR